MLNICKSINSYLLSWCDCYLEKRKDQSFNGQNRRSGEIENGIFHTHKNYVIPHGRHIYKTA